MILRDLSGELTNDNAILMGTCIERLLVPGGRHVIDILRRVEIPIVLARCSHSGEPQDQWIE